MSYGFGTENMGSASWRTTMTRPDPTGNRNLNPEHCSPSKTDNKNCNGRKRTLFFGGLDGGRVEGGSQNAEKVISSEWGCLMSMLSHVLMKYSDAFLTRRSQNAEKVLFFPWRVISSQWGCLMSVLSHEVFECVLLHGIPSHLFASVCQCREGGGDSKFPRTSALNLGRRNSWSNMQKYFNTMSAAKVSHELQHFIQSVSLKAICQTFFIFNDGCRLHTK